MPDRSSPDTATATTATDATDATADAPLPLALDHVEFYVTDLAADVTRLTAEYGFDLLVPPTERGESAERCVSALLGQAAIRLLLTQPLAAGHPATDYLARHQDGVAALALRVPDATAAYRALTGRGADGLRPPQAADGCVTAVVGAFGDVVHTLIERGPGVPADRIPGLPEAVPAGGDGTVGLRSVDHFAVCVPSGELRDTVRHYCEVFGFRMVFEERIEVGALGMDSMVVQSPDHSVTLTLIEPLTPDAGGQIASFLADHGGAGVQHVAFSSEDAVRSVSTMAARGVPFLRTPGAYFDALPARLTPLRHSFDELRDLNLLVDQDHDGQLFQIFTRSQHPRGTFFFEVIERIRARNFGSNNIRALYEAVELQRSASEVAG
ncbi:4-hydroxyphenylpyruvate dioxygenase [Streptomyces sp. CBMA123]|uniref:4-hydroxyphenylpyruvate dioxygenase n=1 Tax=Streptomyces sp. CBMA123 TaxID=1896313 RepID=UPI001661D5A4|nr:4-hydroxyphenylpyruvate dioxygenase [Streptomyces sp. CBMA123]MBD0694496.1 4-hydroxyphenylpyruvate dioxygenase [Streptomyces sp. CBMA123]